MRARSAAPILLALIRAVAFATILAVVAGLTLTSASSVAHDLFANVIMKGRATERSELIVVRIAAFVIGAIAIALAIPAQQLNIAFLVALAFAVAASANLPALIYNLFWRRFNTSGAVCEHLRRPDRRGRPGVLLPGGLRDADVADSERQFRLVPAEQPGSGVDPDRIPLWFPRHHAEQGHLQPGSGTTSCRSVL